ncbi:TetR family transcriptional regulator [Mycobacterium sp. MS1601]|uniref:TetR family transcriptional regulator n=1 Tax=Mycobacterium sp. MS1601 TaxID=1936029 RepID=UPI003FA57448
MSAESRSRLLAAAWELLAEGGSRATTVQSVAERAGSAEVRSPGTSARKKG